MTDRRARGALAGVVFVVLLAQVLLYPGIDDLVAALGAETRVNASMWFLAAEFAAFVAFAAVWGALSDATGRRAPFVAMGAVGGALGYFVLAVAPRFASLDFTALLGIRVLQGAATIGAFSLAITMLMDLDGGHGRNMGAAGIAIGAGTALGAPIGGQLYELGVVLPLYAAGVLLLVAAAVVTVSVTDRAPTSDQNTFVAAIAGVRRTPSLLIPYAFGFVDRFTAGFFALVGTLYFRDPNTFGLDPGTTGLVLALFFAPFALFQYPFGILSDRIGRTIPVVVGSMLYGLAIVGVGLAPSLQLVGVAMVSVGVIGALIAPATMALVTDLATSTERGVAMAGFNVFGSLGFLAGILIGGSVADWFGYFPAFLVAGGAELLIALITIPFFLRLSLQVEADVST